MSMKEELEQELAACSLYDAQEYKEAIIAFEPLTKAGAKYMFNCGVIHATIGEHEAAVQWYQAAIGRDRYLAIAYFQQGVSNFLLGNFEDALVNFNETMKYCRTNNWIDYHQLGLPYKLWSCEALFNRGLCYIYLQMTEDGMRDLEYASKEKAVPEHDVIDEAIKEKAAVGKGYTVFSIPMGCIYRPSASKIKNIASKDYLGKAQLVREASQDATLHRRKISADFWARDDRPADQISYAATHLVRNDLRSRQQSAPPIRRNLYPPTPPPEPEPAPRRISPDRSGGSRSGSVSRLKPEPLNLGKTSFNTGDYGMRRGTTRSASERPRERRPPISRGTSDDPPAPSYGSPLRPVTDRNSSASETAVQRNSLRVDTSRQKLFGSVDHGEQTADVLAALEQHSTSPRSTILSRQRRTMHDQIREEDEGEEASPYDVRSSTSTFPSISVRDDSDARSTYSYRSSKAPPVAFSIRLKVYLDRPDTRDMRTIIVSSGLRFEELVSKVAQKLNIGTALQMKSPDEEGDMITIGDQDDVDTAIVLCKERAAREKAKMGTIEIAVFPL